MTPQIIPYFPIFIIINNDTPHYSWAWTKVIFFHRAPIFPTDYSPQTRVTSMYMIRAEFKGLWVKCAGLNLGQRGSVEAKWMPPGCGGDAVLTVHTREPGTQDQVGLSAYGHMMYMPPHLVSGFICNTAPTLYGTEKGYLP